jgi:hypothetical protein
LSLPELAAITLATALSRFVSHSWFEAAGKIGSPEYGRVQYLFCAGAIAVMVLLAVRNFWRASLLIALVGTALQVFVAYMFGAAMVLWSGVAVIALLLGGLFVSGITSNAHDLHQSGKPRLRVVVVPPAVLVSLSSVDETFLGSQTIRELYRDTISKTYLEIRCPTGPEGTR